MQLKQRRAGARRRRATATGRHMALTMLIVVSLVLSNLTAIVSPAAVWSAIDSPPLAQPTVTSTAVLTASPEPTTTTTTDPAPTAPAAPEPTTTAQPGPGGQGRNEPPAPTATAAPEATPTATIEPEATPTTTVEPEVTPTTTATPEATPAATVEPEAPPTATAEPTPEPLSRPGTPSVAPSSTEPATALAVSWTAPANAGQSAITGYDVRYRKQDTSAWTAHAFSGVATATTLTGLEPDTTYEVQVAASNDEETSHWSNAGTGRTQAPNTPPTITTAEGAGKRLRREVAEKSPAGSAVGATVTATDRDGDSLTFSLSGSDAFTIAATTGQISVANGATLDHETTSSYTVTVSVTDGKDLHGAPDSAVDDSVEVAIAVTDVAELPPHFPAVSSQYVFAQDQDIGTQTLPAAAGGAGGFTYSLSPDLPAGLAFAPATRTITGTPTAAGEYALTYTATDAAGVQASMSFTIAILGTANAEALAQGASAVPAPAKPTVARVKGSTPTLQVTWSAISTSGLTFTVSGYELEYRQQGSSTWTQKSYGSTTTSAELSNLDVAWTAPADHGAAITDYDVQYREAGATEWQEHSFTGTETVTTLTDLRPATTYEVQVRASSGEGTGLWSDTGTGRTHRLRQIVSTPTPDDNDDPDFPSGSPSREIAENSPAGTNVGAPVTATDPDGDPLTYVLSDGTGTFAIGTDTGQITVAPGAVLDYETTRSYVVIVTASDDRGAVAQITVIINVTDVAEASVTPTGLGRVVKLRIGW